MEIRQPIGKMIPVRKNLKRSDIVSRVFHGTNVGTISSLAGEFFDEFESSFSKSKFQISFCGRCKTLNIDGKKFQENREPMLGNRSSSENVAPNDLKDTRETLMIEF